jgi:hypothetical protein
MGSSYPFSCPGCGFEAGVSGGFDVGMVAAVHTISCRECGSLKDVYVGDAPTTSPEDVAAMVLHCPESPDHAVQAWSHPGPCPKCGTPLERGESNICWD